MEITRTAIAELSYDVDDSLLHIRMMKGAEMNIENTIEHYRTIERITGGKKYLALVDASEYFTIDSETLKYTSLPQTIEKRIATAHYQSALGNKLTMDFFRKFHKPPLPVNLFETKEEAIEWLKRQWNETMNKN